MGVAPGRRHGNGPQQLIVVRDVLQENGFRTWLTELRHALAGRVAVPAVVNGPLIANLSAVHNINRVQRRSGGEVREPDIQTLNNVLAAEKPRVAARIRNPNAPLYVENGQLCIGFLLDSEVLRSAASAAIAGYCAETPGPKHKAFKVLDEIGQLVLGPVRPTLDGDVRVDSSAYKHPGFSSAADLQAFCEDPNDYLEGISGGSTVYPQSIAFGPMRVVVAYSEAAMTASPAKLDPILPVRRPSYELAWDAGR